LRGELIHEAIRQWIAEGNAEFENIHPSPIEREREIVRGRKVRIAGADVNDKALFSVALEALKPFADPIHSVHRDCQAQSASDKRLLETPLEFGTGRFHVGRIQYRRNNTYPASPSRENVIDCIQIHATNSEPRDTNVR
jgi:hypothetical protein